jgi:hypothetical protein
MKTNRTFQLAVRPWMLTAALPLLLGSSLQGEIKGEKLGKGFVRTKEEKSGSAVQAFVERDGKRFGKIDAFTFSSFVKAGSQCSFVPTDSILYVPDSMKARVSKEKSENMILWPKFYRRYTAFFHTVEVSPDEYTGKKPISEARMTQWQSLGRIVVAVYRGNPISVPKPKQKPEPAVAAK